MGGFDGQVPYLVVPLLDGQRMGDGKPVPVHLKVGGFAADDE